MNGQKAPHRPEKYLGRWALAMNHRLFKIEKAGTDKAGLPYYEGRALGGGYVRTFSAEVLLDERDHMILEEVSTYD
jgi:hypothetical protein